MNSQVLFRGQLLLRDVTITRRKEMKLIGLKRAGENNEQGFTLLEYTVGAALLMGFIVLGMNAMGVSFQNMLTNLGGWAEANSTPAGGNQP